MSHPAPTLYRLAAVCWLAGFSAASGRSEDAPVSPTETEAAYVYKAESRDPFVPLTGTGMTMVGGGAEEEGEFNPGSVELTGILKTKTGRWAVLRIPAGGSYLVKDGKIQDSKRKAVKGYVGIVKEKSLVLIGPNNQVTELKLKKDQEESLP